MQGRVSSQGADTSLAAGSDVEEKDEDGFTPLLNAAYFGTGTGTGRGKLMGKSYI